MFLLADDCALETAEGFCLVTVLLADDTAPDDLEAVTVLRDVLLLLIVPRLVLELVPMPLLTVVRSAFAKTLPSG